MQIEVRSCASAAESSRVRRLLDQEFVVSRNRPPLLARRYPEAFSPENRGNLVYAAIEGRIAGALLLRCFEWSCEGRRERGAMIGAVCTAMAFRGRGIAAEMLGHARRLAASQGAAFGVLWTAHPRVYRRSGWRGGDRGLRGDWVTGSKAGRLQLGAPVNHRLAGRLHDMRSAMHPEGVARSVRGFTAIPMPAAHVEAFVRDDAYALAGRRADEGYLYEMVGAESAFDGLVECLRGAFSRVTVNCVANGPVQRAFSRRARMAWNPQPLSMWIALTRRRLPFSRWYVDYLDRI